MFQNLKNVIEQIGKDEGIEKSVLVEALESAMLTVAKKMYGYKKDLEAHFNEENGEIEIHQFRTVVEEVTDEEVEIGVEEARALDPDCQIGDSIGGKVDASDFGRIAAQTAKQVIIQKIRDAKREIIYKEYIDRKGDIVTGIVRKYERGDMIVDLGRTEAVLPKREQLPGESYKLGARIQGVILEVHKQSKGPQIVLSRGHETFLTKLFEMEVPEIYEGIVRIQAVAREPGGRAKIAVYSKDSDVDPVGACVGMKGARVQSVVSNLRGEKIDIVPFDQDPVKFVCNAIAPAQISRIRMDEENKTMELIVADDQLSLAIGKRGQNVRLASKLSGWKLDITSETDLMRRGKEGKILLRDLPGVGTANAEVLRGYGIETTEDVLGVDAEKIRQVPGFGENATKELRHLAGIFDAYRTRTIEFVRARYPEVADSFESQNLELFRIRGVGMAFAKRLIRHNVRSLLGMNPGNVEGAITRLERDGLPEDLKTDFLTALKEYYSRMEAVSSVEDKSTIGQEYFDEQIQDVSFDERWPLSETELAAEIERSRSAREASQAGNNPPPGQATEAGASEDASAPNEESGESAANSDEVKAATDSDEMAPEGASESAEEKQTEVS